VHVHLRLYPEAKEVIGHHYTASNKMDAQVNCTDASNRTSAGTHRGPAASQRKRNTATFSTNSFGLHTSPVGSHAV
jgi:hypothetical protein